ncbi:hypothetical protein [Micromonospora humida]|uniref:hypothetical protein n=1 Tax=Micromonospora humida TaxID=2809018 RepID=UPI00341CC4A9
MVNNIPAGRKPPNRKKTAAKTSPTSRVETRDNQDPRWSVRHLALLLKENATGASLSINEMRTLKSVQGSVVFPAALRYAEVLAESEAMATRTEEPAATQLRTLIRQRVEVVDRWEKHHARRLAEARQTGFVTERLSILVVRGIAGDKYDQALSAVLRQRGLQAEALSLPTGKLWNWLAHAGAEQFHGLVALPHPVRRLVQMHDAAFLATVIADAKKLQPDANLEHPAVVERWAADAVRAEEVLRSARDQAALPLRRGVSKSQERSTTKSLRAAADAYAMAAARRLTADLLLRDLRLQVEQTYWQEPFQRFRLARQMEAAETIFRAEPALAVQVGLASAEHRETCTRWSARNPCLACAPDVITVVRERMASPRPAEPVEVPAVVPAAASPPTAGEPSTAARPTCSVSLDSFTCAPTGGGLVGVTEVRYDDTTGRFGFAWLTAYGEWGTGDGQAVNVHDAWLQAVCSSVLELGGGVARTQVICRDVRAASVMNHVLKVRLIAEELGFPVNDRTRELLAQLMKCRGRASAAANDCPEHHRGVAGAAQLADLALDAQQAGGSAALAAAPEQISEAIRGLAQATAMPSRENDDGARWLPGGESDAGEVSWQSAARKAQISGGWTSLPAGLRAAPSAMRRLRLVINHPVRQSPTKTTESEVLLRRIGDRWELHGVLWPKKLLPGTLITFRWRVDQQLITATSELRSQPHRVDDVTYQHRYDIRAVTRDGAPGAGLGGEGLNLSDGGWVMRTLRTLGHLSADGSAILAEEALVRNCLELGMPRSRVDRVHPAVERMLTKRQLGRVAGSIDANGQPSHPPRPGETGAKLLRYVPRVERLVPPPPESAKHFGGGEQVVGGFVRRLPAGRQASDEQIELHQEAVRAKQVVNRPLPDGYTFVRPHRRNR